MEKSIQDFKEVFEGALSEKKLRDSLNTEVKKFKDERSTLIQESDSMKKELENLHLQIKKFSTYEILKKKLNALEYKLHFEGENPAREKEISKAMSEIEEKIKEIIPEKSEGSIEEIKKKIKGLDLKIKSLSREIELKAGESEKHHKKMIELYQKSDEFRKKISERVSQPVKKEKPHKTENAERKSKINIEFKKIAERLLDDFKKGKKLSFEELQIIQEASA
jgi:uncharacterized coiled-coil DUF342 family protein